MQINLEVQDLRMLLSLIDVAVKAGGLQTAEAGVHYAKKFKEAIDNETKS